MGALTKGIVEGTLTKSDVEIVLARYEEDIEWSDVYDNIRTVYCKSETYNDRGCIPLKNVGREGHTYLHHIVQNYYNLSKWTVFSQAQSPTQGYRGHRKGGGHMLPGVPFDAYLLTEEQGGLPRGDGTAFVFTGALHKPTLNHSLRLSFLYSSVNPVLHTQSKCPTTAMLDGWQKWWDLGWFKTYLGGKCGVKSTEVPAFFETYWNEYIDLPQPKDDIIFFSQGARFAASRERIQQRPKKDYERLLNLLSETEDPCHNYANEWMWYYMIGKPTESPCSSEDVTREASRMRSLTTNELLESYRAELKAKEKAEKDEYDSQFSAEDGKREDDYLRNYDAEAAP